MNGKRLKNSILQWAIQGKLVPQDPDDEPASKLLGRIRREKEHLIKEKKIKRGNNESIIYRGEDNSYYERLVTTGEVKCIDGEIPFEIPSSWTVLRLKDVCQLVDGEMKTGKGICLDAKYLRTKSSAVIIESGKYVYAGDSIILVDGENSGEVFTVPQDGYMGSTFKQLWLSKVMHKPYILTFIQFYKDTLRNSKKGAAIPHLNKSLFYNLCIGIPPLAEQRRIVTKLEELLPLVEKYDKAQCELDALNKSIYVQLKKSILQEAIQGRLVQQDLREEPASELLGLIRREKERLIKEKKIKRDKNETVIYRGDDNSYYERFVATGKVKCIDEEIPFEIPQSWEWCRLGSICSKFSTGPFGTMVHKKDYTEDGHPIINPTNIKGMTIDETAIKRVSELKYNELSAYVLKENDIVLARRGDLSKCAIVTCNQDGWLAGTGAFSLRIPYINLSFFVLLYKSSYVQDYLIGDSVGTTMNNLNQTLLYQLLLPLPPLAEQHSIAAKLEEVFSTLNQD